MIQPTFESRGAKEVQRKVAKFRRSDPVKDIITTATLKVLDRIKNVEIKQGAPGDAPVSHYLTERHGGRGIVGGIHSHIRKMAGGRESTVGAGGLKGAILKAHELGLTIRPKRKKFLVFKTSDGTWHSVKRVHLKSRQTFRRAERWAEKEVKPWARDKIRDHLRKAGLK